MGTQSVKEKRTRETTNYDNTSDKTMIKRDNDKKRATVVIVHCAVFRMIIEVSQKAQQSRPNGMLLVK
jgi:hypothetical protein